MEIGVFEAKNRLSELLDRAAQGEEVIITRRGRPYAKLGPVSERLTRQELDALMASVRERRNRLAPVTWDELKRDRDEGRRG